MEQSFDPRSRRINAASNLVFSSVGVNMMTDLYLLRSVCVCEGHCCLSVPSVQRTGRRVNTHYRQLHYSALPVSMFKVMTFFYLVCSGACF